MEEGRAAIAKGDYASAMRLLMPSAAAGHADAQNAIGYLYKEGWGIAKDGAQAVKWFRAAALQGHPRASFNLGQMYDEGSGTARDPAQAFAWYRRSAEQGFPPAQAALGAMYATGEGVRQDHTEALKWYTRAAEQGLAQAQFRLGVLYARGEGIPRDDARAQNLLRKAGAEGHAGARAYLEQHYASAAAVSPAQPVNAALLAAALRSPADELAFSYGGVKQLLQMLRLAEGGATIQTPQGTINAANVNEKRAELNERLSAYAAAISQRGYTKLGGAYDASATPACDRVPSMWAAGIRRGELRRATLVQDDHHVRVSHEFTWQGKPQTYSMDAIVVESVLGLGDPMDPAMVFRGEVARTGEIVISPRADAILGAWPSWARAPSRADLAGCSITLAPGSR